MAYPLHAPSSTPVTAPGCCSGASSLPQGFLLKVGLVVRSDRGSPGNSNGGGAGCILTAYQAGPVCSFSNLRKLILEMLGRTLKQSPWCRRVLKAAGLWCSVGRLPGNRPLGGWPGAAPGLGRQGSPTCRAGQGADVWLFWDRWVWARTGSPDALISQVVEATHRSLCSDSRAPPGVLEVPSLPGEAQTSDPCAGLWGNHGALCLP